MNEAQPAHRSPGYIFRRAIQLNHVWPFDCDIFALH
jgi:hypothetical protein